MKKLIGLAIALAFMLVCSTAFARFPCPKEQNGEPTACWTRGEQACKDHGGLESGTCGTSDLRHCRYTCKNGKAVTPIDKATPEKLKEKPGSLPVKK